MDAVWAAEAAAEGGGGGGYWQLAMILAAIGFLGLFSRWRKSRIPPAPSPRELRDRDENPNRYRDAADRAIVELLETSQTLNAQVDTKIRILNRLVKEAEDNCARLEKLLAAANDLHEGRQPDRPAAGAPPPPEKPAPAEPKFLSELHERIYRMKEEGRSAAEIAKATNLSTTEVEFVVKLF